MEGRECIKGRTVLAERIILQRITPVFPHHVQLYLVFARPGLRAGVPSCKSPCAVC